MTETQPYDSVSSDEILKPAMTICNRNQGSIVLTPAYSLSLHHITISQYVGKGWFT